MFLDRKHAHKVVSTRVLGEKYKILALLNITKRVKTFVNSVDRLIGISTCRRRRYAGMQLLKARCPDEAAPLLEYFDQTYVSGMYVQRRR